MKPLAERRDAAIREGRPLCKERARIETIAWISRAANIAVARSAKSGRGLKHRVR